MSNAELKSLAKEQIKGNILMLIIIAVIISTINGVVRVIPVIGWVAVFFSCGVLSISLAAIYLNLAKGQKPNIEDLQLGMNQWKEGAMLYLLLVIYVTLWSLLFIIPGLIKYISYSQAFYILADNPGMSGQQALEESKKMMNGRKWEYFMLSLSFIGWELLSICTFGIAYIYVIPYSTATFTNYYNSIKGGNAYTVE